jgi:SEC-C motif-containing protein
MPDAPGRNDPCPCGSGQKYKKCCLLKHDAAAATARPRTSGRTAALQALLRFAFSDQFATDHVIGQTLFWTDRLDRMDERAVRELVGSDDAIAKYNIWFAFDLDIDEGRTVADMFLAQRGWTVGPDERQFIERVRAVTMRLYQIEAVERDTGVHLIDLWTKDRVFVHERLGTEQMVRWDLVGARVVPNETGVPMFEGGLYLYPVDAKAAC